MATGRPSKDLVIAGFVIIWLFWALTERGHLQHSSSVPVQRSTSDDTSLVPTEGQPGCIIRIYARNGWSHYLEQSWMASIVFSPQILPRCGCKYQVVSTNSFGADVRTSTEPFKPSVVVFGTEFASADDVQVLTSVPAAVKDSAVLFHLSDEGLHDDTALYQGFRAVFRNYERPSVAEVEYLETEVPFVPTSKTHWLPLGFGNTNRAFTTSWSRRTLLWAWAGSTFGSRQGKELAKAIRGHVRQSELLDPKLSFFRSFVHFADSAAIKALQEYSSILANAKFVPVPSGNSPEQFRLFEALDCGTIPIILQRDSGSEGSLRWLQQLGLEVVILHEWWELGDFLLQEASKEVWVEKQIALHQQWLRVKARFQSYMTQAVCGLGQ